MDGGEEGGAEVGVEILVLGHLVDFLPFLLNHSLQLCFGLGLSHFDILLQVTPHILDWPEICKLC